MIRCKQFAAIGQLLTFVLIAVPALGHDTGPEFIESFDTTLELRKDGALSVRHVIDVHPHGDEIRRGLFFELPEDVGPLTDFAATLAGDPIEPELDDGDVIVAAAEPLATHQRHRFELRYRARSPWWLESADTARLRWQPIIAQFELAWRDSSVRILWPEGGAPESLPDGGSVDGNSWLRRYRGPLYADRADEAAGRIELRTGASALPEQAVRRFGSDWPWRMLLAAGLIGLLGYLHGAWRAVGRDPGTGTVGQRETPPDGLSPAATRFVDRLGFDQMAFAAALVSLRVKQAVTLGVDEDEQRLWLERKSRSTRGLSPGERALVETLFESGERVEFGPGDELVARASKALERKLGEEHRGRHFVTNAAQRTWGLVLGGVLIALSIAALVVQAQDALTPDPWVVGLGLAGLLCGIVAPLVYFELFKAPTRAGASIKRQIAGLKRYFEDDTPVRDADRFVQLLPYAVALDFEQAWRDRFRGQDEAGVDKDTAEVLAWYRELQRRHETIGAILPAIAGSTAAHASTGAGGGGASAGGV